MLTRGISLLIGGYPNEMQMLMMMKAGYVLSTSNYFFFYFVAIALLYLIGQRTQRAVLTQELEEQENKSQSGVLESVQSQLQEPLLTD